MQVRTSSDKIDIQSLNTEIKISGKKYPLSVKIEDDNLNVTEKAYKNAVIDEFYKQQIQLIEELKVLDNQPKSEIKIEHGLLDNNQNLDTLLDDIEIRQKASDYYSDQIDGFLIVGGASTVKSFYELDFVDRVNTTLIDNNRVEQEAELLHDKTEDILADPDTSNEQKIQKIEEVIATSINDNLTQEQRAALDQQPEIDFLTPDLQNLINTKITEDLSGNLSISSSSLIELGLSESQAEEVQKSVNDYNQIPETVKDGTAQALQEMSENTDSSHNEPELLGSLLFGISAEAWTYRGRAGYIMEVYWWGVRYFVSPRMIEHMEWFGGTVGTLGGLLSLAGVSMGCAGPQVVACTAVAGSLAVGWFAIITTNRFVCRSRGVWVSVNWVRRFSISCG